MAKYRELPLTIEAFQFNGNKNQKTPQWFKDAVKNEIIRPYYDRKRLRIETLEGTMTAHVNDYIIKGVHGELYPCDPDIFSLTYELVE